MSLVAGSRLGPYEVLTPLGAGGMGEVYKARDTRLDRTVAIKVLAVSAAGCVLGTGSYKGRSVKRTHLIVPIVPSTTVDIMAKHGAADRQEIFSSNKALAGQEGCVLDAIVHWYGQYGFCVLPNENHAYGWVFLRR